jgi:hypothetical protein
MTKRQISILITVVALALSAWMLWSATANKGVAADIQKLADLVAKPDDAAFKQVAGAVAQKYK